VGDPAHVVGPGDEPYEHPGFAHYHLCLAAEITLVDAITGGQEPRVCLPTFGVVSVTVLTLELAPVGEVAGHNSDPTADQDAE
jgi:hypothetical protein